MDVPVTRYCPWGWSPLRDDIYDISTVMNGRLHIRDTCCVVDVHIYASSSWMILDEVYGLYNHAGTKESRKLLIPAHWFERIGL